MEKENKQVSNKNYVIEQVNKNQKLYIVHCVIIFIKNMYFQTAFLYYFLHVYLQSKI